MRDRNEAWNSPRTYACKVRSVACPAPRVSVVRLEVLSGGMLHFSAGQYVCVTFPGAPPRDYSMANRPDEPILEFHIRESRNNRTGPTLLERLKPGDPATIEGPFGDAWLRATHTGPILAVAGGSGIAPAKSIVETALANAMGQDIHLYFGVRSEADLYLEAHFRALAAEHPNFRFTPVLSDAKGKTDRRRGLVADAVAEDFADLTGWKAYVAGPRTMVQAAVRLVTARGLEPEDIHADAHVSNPK